GSRPWLLDPRVRRREQDAQTDPLPVLATELPQRDRLLVAAKRRRDLGRDVAAMHAPLGVVDRDRIRVVLVLGLRNERESPPRREPVVLQRVGAVRGAGELDDAHTRVVPLHRVPGRGVAQPVARLAAVEPDAQAFRTRGVAWRHRRPARPTAYSDLRSSSTDT